MTYIKDTEVLPFSLELETFYSDEEGTEIVLEVGEMVFVHFSYKNMTKAKYRKTMKLWEELKDSLRERGYNEVFTITPSHLPIADRNEKWFGFTLIEEKDGVKLFMKDLREE